MEAIFAPSPADRHRPAAASPYKQMKSQPAKKNTRGFMSGRPSCENFVHPTNNNNGGIFFGPSPPISLSFSYPPVPGSYPVFHNPNLHQQQPPLLPLPVLKPQRSLPAPRSRGLSSPSTPRKINNSRSSNRDQSLTPKKSKQPTKKEEPNKQRDRKTVDHEGGAILSATVPLGPDPDDLPKDVSRVLLSSSSSSSSLSSLAAMKDFERFSDSVYTVLAPPPSSLPLPKFPIRPKLISCTAEAAGNIDAGATDNLRRLLRLR